MFQGVQFVSLRCAFFVMIHHSVWVFFVFLLAMWKWFLKMLHVLFICYFIVLYKVFFVNENLFTKKKLTPLE